MRTISKTKVQRDTCAKGPISRNARPPRQPRFPRRLHLFLTALLQPLCLYTAAAITAFGWMVSRWAGLDPAPFAPLWAAGALFIYNVDRLSPDPADAVNLPQRTRRHDDLRPVSITTAFLAGLALLALPIWERDWLLLALVIGGALACASYSVPVFGGYRAKQLPGLKTLLVPLLVTGAYFVPFATRGAFPQDLRVVAWSFGVLLINMMLCDLRDLPGDRAAGTRTIPVLLGARASHLALGAFTVLLIPLCPRPAQAITLGVYALLQIAALRPRSEAFYAWIVDGALFLPALVNAVW